MGVVDDTLFELKLALDRALSGMFGGNKESKRSKFCPACGTSNPEEASNCSKCYRSFKFYERK